MSGKSAVDRVHPWRAGFQDSLSMRLARTRRAPSGLAPVRERQHQIARLEEQLRSSGQGVPVPQQASYLTVRGE